MPIVARQPGLDPTAGPRTGDDAATGGSVPPEDLLPSGGPLAPAPALAPHRALALDALHVLRTLRDRPRDADSWGEPAFAWEVDLVRGHLAPIRDRRGLAASYGREAFRTRPVGGSADPPTLRPTSVAYAVRWLELGDGQIRPGWTSLVTGRA